MALLQGSSYYLEFYIKDASGNPVTNETVLTATFTIGDITKTGDEVSYNAELGAWIVFLSEEETFAFQDKNIEWQARFKFVGGLIDGTQPKSEYVYKSINKVKLSGGGEDA